MNEPSMLEKVTGSLPASLTVNALAVAGATFTPWSAFAPYLLQTLASRRQSERVDGMLAELSTAIAALQVDLRNITDDQYKLAGECIVSSFSTVDSQKLEFIRFAVLNSLADPAIPLGTSDALGRLVRDISAAEVVFLVHAFRYSGIGIDDNQVSEKDRLFVKPNSPEEMLIGSLIRLGLLYARSTTWDSMMYEWSPLTAKFIALVSPQGKCQSTV